MTQTSPERRKDRRGPIDADRHVAAQLQARRTLLGMTLQDLAFVLGVTYQQVQKYECGANRLSAGRLHQAAAMLGVDPGYFFEGFGQAPVPSPQHRLQLEMGKAFAGIASLEQRRALVALARAMAEQEVINNE